MSKKKLNIRKGDMVQVMAGVDKGKQGEVLEVLPARERVLVEGVNTVHKHRKPDANNPDGGIQKAEAPVHVSNVMLLDPKTGEPTRVKRERTDAGVVRISKKSGQEI